MDTKSTSLIGKLTKQMSYLTERQAVLAENMANIDTPNYRAKDLKKMDFGAAMSAQSGPLMMRTTSPKHLGGSLAGGTSFATINARDTFETTPVGNNVVLEEQMADISDTGAQYQISSSILKKFVQFHQIATGNR